VDRERDKASELTYDDHGNPIEQYTPASAPQPKLQTDDTEDSLTGLGKSKGRLLAYLDLLSSSQGEYKNAGIFPGSHQDFRLDASPFRRVASFSLSIEDLFAIREGTTLHYIAQHNKTSQPEASSGSHYQGPPGSVRRRRAPSRTDTDTAIRTYLSQDLGLDGQAIEAFESIRWRGGPYDYNDYMYDWYSYGAYGSVSDAGDDDDEVVDGDGLGEGWGEDELDEESWHD